MDFQLPGERFRCIAPFADMLNHSLDVQLCHIYDPQSGSLQIFAGKDYTIGEQVTCFFTLLMCSWLTQIFSIII